MENADEIPVRNIPTKALVVEKPGAPFVLKDVILDEVRDDEVLVEMKYTGLCHTDLVVQHGGMPVGKYPAILGHEGAGIIRRIGAQVKNKELKLGDAVLLSFHSCRRCRHCTDGQLGSCPHITEINFGGLRRSDASSPACLPDGSFLRGQFFGQSSFSKLAVVAEDSIVKCDISVDDLFVMAPLGCGYFTGAGTVMNVLKPTAETSIAILGMGGVGLSALMAAKALGAKRIICVDILTSKLEKATALGATDVIDLFQQGDLSAAIHGILAGGVDMALDTTGVAKVIEQGVNSLSHAGTMALVGVPRPGQTITIDPLQFLVSCKTLVGVIEAASDPKHLIPVLVQLYRQGKFPIDQISTVYPVANLSQAIKDLGEGKTTKPILSWESV